MPNLTKQGLLCTPTPGPLTTCPHQLRTEGQKLREPNTSTTAPAGNEFPSAGNRFRSAWPPSLIIHSPSKCLWTSPTVTEANNAGLLVATLGRIAKNCVNYPNLRRVLIDSGRPKMANIYSVTMLIKFLVFVFAKKRWGGFCAATSPLETGVSNLLTIVEDTVVID